MKHEWLITNGGGTTIISAYSGGADCITNEGDIPIKNDWSVITNEGYGD